MITGRAKNYYITSNMQKISLIHRFILKIKQILESRDLKVTTIFDHSIRDTMYEHEKNPFNLFIQSRDAGKSHDLKRHTHI